MSRTKDEELLHDLSNKSTIIHWKLKVLLKQASPDLQEDLNKVFNASEESIKIIEEFKDHIKNKDFKAA